MTYNNYYKISSNYNIIALLVFQIEIKIKLTRLKARLRARV